MSGKRRRSDSGDGDESSTGRYPQRNDTTDNSSRTPHRTLPISQGKDADAYYRSLYTSELDFAQLGRDDPDLGKQYEPCDACSLLC